MKMEDLTGFRFKCLTADFLYGGFQRAATNGSKALSVLLHQQPGSFGSWCGTMGVHYFRNDKRFSFFQKIPRFRLPLVPSRLRLVRFRNFFDKTIPASSIS